MGRVRAPALFPPYAAPAASEVDKGIGAIAEANQPRGRGKCERSPLPLMLRREVGSNFFVWKWGQDSSLASLFYFRQSCRFAALPPWRWCPRWGETTEIRTPNNLGSKKPPIKANFLFPVSKALPLFYSGLLSARAFKRESFIWPYKCLRESLGRKDVRIKKLRNLEELK